VEAAWGKVAQDIGQDLGYVVAATHGKRAINNLSHFKPHIKEHEMDSEVTKFEESILYFADAHRLHGPGGITPAPVTNTADDKRLKAGKPAPDPFLLPLTALDTIQKDALYSKIPQAVFVQVSRECYCHCRLHKS
jgi:hypothetical protein